MARLSAFWTWLWTRHIQKVMATILAGSALYDEAIDAYSALVTYQPELGEVLGHENYRRIRLACVSIIFLRAVIRPKPPP